MSIEMSCLDTNRTPPTEAARGKAPTEMHPSCRVTGKSRNSIVDNVEVKCNSMADNCGFKVIREDNSCKVGFHYESDQSEQSSIEVTDSYLGRWSTDTSRASDEIARIDKDSIVDSIQPGNGLDLEHGDQELTGSETCLVSRKNGIPCEPTVDYLDMTDNGHPMDNYIHNLNPRTGKRGEGSSCLALADVQHTFKSDSQRKAGTGERRTRHRVNGHNLSNVKSGSVDVRRKVRSLSTFKNRSIGLQVRMGNVSASDTESMTPMFNISCLTSRANMAKLCFNSLRLDDVRKRGKQVKSITNKDEHHRCEIIDELNCRMTGRTDESTSGNYCIVHGDVINSDLNPECGVAFGNINSSCLRPGSDQQSPKTTRNRVEEGGMISYLRKMNSKANNEWDELEAEQSRGQMNCAQCRQHHECMNHEPECADNHCASCTKGGTTVSNKCATPQSQRWGAPREKTSPNRLKVAPRLTRAEFQNSGSEMTTSGESFTFSKESGDTSGSSVHTEENRPHNHNINFNSEEECDDNVCSNSFIGHYLYELWKHQCLCDIRLKVGNTSFLAHKLVLAAFSDLFCPDDPQQIPTLCFEIEDISEEALCLILQYLYTSEMEITDSVLEAVYNAACLLEITEVVDLVTEILSKPTVENFENYMAIRLRIGLGTNVMEDYKDFISENLLDLEDSPFILNMSLTQMETLLCDPDVKIESEIDMVRLIIKWVKYNPCQRCKHVAPLLSLVNFDCVEPQALSIIVEQNRYLFDLPSMDIIMAAFKDYALKCKEAEKSEDIYNTKASRPRNGAYSPMQGREGNGECNCREPCECQDGSPSDYAQSGDNFEQSNRSKKMNAMSPQEIRRNATRQCWGKDKKSAPASCYGNCYQYEMDKGCVKSNGAGVCLPNSETKHIIRKSRNGCDSSNNFPSEFSDQKSKSLSSESRCGQFCRRVSSARSESDTGQPMCTCCCTPDGYYERKRVLPKYAGNFNGEPTEASKCLVQERCSNCVARDRTCCEGRGNCRGPNNCQACSQLRSSPGSSVTSQRCTGSSLGSCKRVTFS